MINQINIKNFKSIVDMTIPLGRFNVIIGPNGCGKSNILEAIAFSAASTENKLDYEYLINRDVRVSEPEFMINGFDDEDDDLPDDDENTKDIIRVQVDDDKHPFFMSA